MRSGVLLVVVALGACRRPASDEARPDTGTALGSVTTSVVASGAPLDAATSASTADAAGLQADAPPDGVGGTPDAGDAAAPAPMRREDWEVAIGKWTFEPTGEAWCECKANSSLLWWKHDRPQDFDASVEVKFRGSESSAGILFRAKGEDFYKDAAFYQFEWYTRGSHHDRRLSLMKKNPHWVQIVEPKYPEAPYDRWISLRVVAEGDRIRTYVDGEEVFDKRDTTFVRPGKIGLHVFQPRKTWFRNFRLQPLSP